MMTDSEISMFSRTIDHSADGCHEYSSDRHTDHGVFLCFLCFVDPCGRHHESAADQDRDFT